MYVKKNSLKLWKMTEFKNYWVNEFAESNYVVNPCTVPHCMIIQYANGLIHHMIAYFGLTEHMNTHFWSNVKLIKEHTHS